MTTKDARAVATYKQEQEHREEQQGRPEVLLDDHDRQGDGPHGDHRGEVRQGREAERPDLRRFLDEERAILRQVPRQEDDQQDLDELGRLAAHRPTERVRRWPLTSCPNTKVISRIATPSAAQLYL